MAFARKTVSLAARIGVALSVAVALGVGGIVYADEAEKAGAAQQMLKNGVTVKAEPTYASASTKRRRAGSTTTYSIRYAFWDAQMRRVDGHDVATQSEFDALADPDNASSIRQGATVDVVYDRTDPSKNGLKSRFESESSLDFGSIGGAAGGALFFALLIAGYIYSFMKKRIAPDAVTTPAPAGKPPAVP